MDTIGDDNKRRLFEDRCMVVGSTIFIGLFIGVLMLILWLIFLGIKLLVWPVIVSLLTR